MAMGDDQWAVSRRTALLGTALATTAAGISAPASAALAPDDEAGWARIAALYPVTRAITQLENGYWGSMATPVQAAHRAMLDKLNRDNSWYARRAMLKDLGLAKARAAEAMGVAPEEMAFCRNAAEGLAALISQFRDLGPRDRILMYYYCSISELLITI